MLMFLCINIDAGRTTALGRAEIAVRLSTLIPTPAMAETGVMGVEAAGRAVCTGLVALEGVWTETAPEAPPIWFCRGVTIPSRTFGCVLTLTS
jgi:hypothetical protein